MHFPYFIHVGPWRIHPHLLFEFLAYLVGGRLFFWLRKRWEDPIEEGTRLWIVASAAIGAALGAKLVHALDELPAFMGAHGDWMALLSGKSIVGALLGGLIGVELSKKFMGETKSTGDLFVLPLCLGMAIGRVGCFLTGLSDLTCGTPTELPWGVDFGDGIPRHPAQLYEILCLALIAMWAYRQRDRIAQPGDLFKGFMVLYLLLRLAVDALKPDPRWFLGLSGIQLVCIAGLAYYARHIPRVFLKAAPSHA